MKTAETAPPRVLVVDDDAEIRQLVRLKLGNAFAFRVDEARSADEAIQRLRAEPFDLVVCDLNMETSTGREVFNYIQEHRTSGTAFILFSSGVEGLSPSERNEFVAVPKANFEQLMSAVTRLVPPSRVQRRPVLLP